MEFDIGPLRKLADESPDNWLVHAQLSDGLHRSGLDVEALAAIDRAIELNPMEVMLYGLKADIQVNLGLPQEAANTLMAGLQRENNAQLHSSLGLLFLQQRILNPAIQHLASAAEIDAEPRHWFNLANAYMQSRNFELAQDYFQRAISLDATYVRARRNLALCLVEQKQYPQAIEQLKSAIAIDPSHADTWFTLGFINRLTDDFDAAIDALQKCLQLEPDHERAWEMLGRAQFESGQIEKAKDTFEQWLNQQPDHPIATHMRAAIDGSQEIDRASEQYVAAAFDQFADSFETVLEKLQYRVPALIKSKLRERSLLPDRGEVLDAGCGTGLCGAFLAKKGIQLTGVDLSQGMLDQAETTGFYDKLVRADLIKFMSEHVSKFDLVVAGDTFNYFGDLNSLFDALARTLTENGSAIFSLEKGTPQQEGFHLNSSGRFKHSIEYIRKCLTQTDFHVVDCAEIVMRVENEEAVMGYLITAKTQRS